MSSARRTKKEAGFVPVGWKVLVGWKSGAASDIISRVKYDYLDDHRKLVQFCGEIAGAGCIAFDTEFVSEDSYRPELCLIQVAAGGHLGVIDPLAIEDLAPFWQLLAEPGRETIVHAGRHEFCFCLQAIGRRPAALFDIQIAAGLIGLEFPAAYGTLVTKLLGKSLRKGETRTDWRRRPLSHRQLEYALQDVVHLEPIRDVLRQRLAALGRTDWLAAELEDWQADVETAEFQDRWRRMSGTSNLGPRALAIARELWQWRDTEAQRRNSPARRILRDDLIAELAKGETDDIHRIQAIRGLNRRGQERQLAALAAAIRRGLELPDEACPAPLSRTVNRLQFNLLGQFLATALASVCRGQQVAPSLVGTVEDVRDLIAYHLASPGSASQPPPALARGWRSEVVGRVIEDLIEGRMTIRVGDPASEQPLILEPRTEAPS
ncbi:MAG: ribonuclease D [Pirellulaceae bacterium]|nr:ribonuclease D [Pirellulaceae bacterium]